jgi:hypothetical protein
MKEEKFEKVVEYKWEDKIMDKYSLFTLITWITLTKVINSWSFVFFQYALISLVIIFSIKRKVHRRKI